MRIKFYAPAFVTPSLILSFILFNAMGCRQQESAWRGSIKDEKGITVVRNPAQPIYKKDIISFEEELQIGSADKSDKYIFSAIDGLDVDDNGHIYVLDSRAAQVKVFGPDGEYLRSIGGRGQGPGEMQMPLFLQITADNELVVQDLAAQHFLYFSLDGQFLGKEAYWKERALRAVKIDQQGNLIGLKIGAPPPMGGWVLRKYNSNFEPIMTLAEQPPDMAAKTEYNILRPTFYFDVFANDNIILGHSGKYELDILNPEGKLIKKILKKHRRMRIRDDDKDFYRERYESFIKIGGKVKFPNHFPCFCGLAVDDKGRIFVKTFEREKSKKDMFYFDLFDEEGKYLAKMPIAINLDRDSVWKNGKLYMVETSQDEVPMVKRFRVSLNLHH
ncbi:MAG: 6-bladed beta-propeller [Acidobacteriota bacterium]|nr:6-bladed beta-propeller [Acidobacteriota bacterium]